MENKKELIVLIDPNLHYWATIGMVIWLIPIGVLLGFYGVVNYYFSGPIYYLLSFLVIGPLIFACLICLGILLGTFSFPKKEEPMAIINQDGIWMARFGLIPWKEIVEFGPYSYRGTPEVIGIRVKDNDKISRQSSIAGKLDFFWARWIGYPPIRITGIALPNNEVINFAKQFLKN